MILGPPIVQFSCPSCGEITRHPQWVTVFWLGPNWWGLWFWCPRCDGLAGKECGDPRLVTRLVEHGARIFA